MLVRQDARSENMSTSSKTTILIADELALVREGIATFCQASDRFSVIDQCQDGAAALASLESNPADLALVDFQIPKLFSLEMIRKAKDLALQTRFLIMSTRGDRKMALEALRSGANGFVLKSSSGAQLIEALAQVAAGSIYVSPELEFEKVFMGNRRKQSEDPIQSLSSREYQVFQLMIDGVRAKEIAARLDLSPKTVDTYRASLMRKLDIHDVAGLVKYAIHRELTTAC